MAITTLIRKFDEQQDIALVDKNNDVGITIEIPTAYVDTGHQYKSIRLDGPDKPKGAPELSQNLRTLALSQSHKWQTSVNFPWLRVRLSSFKEAGTGRPVPVLFICFETNLSDGRRGTELAKSEAGDNTEIINASRKDSYLSDLLANVGEPTQFGTRHSDILIKISRSDEPEPESALAVRLLITWKDQKIASEEAPVDLLVDLGNSRTAAALFEPPFAGGFIFGTGKSLRNFIRPLFYLDRDERDMKILGDTNGSNDPIVDSWLALDETDNSGVEFIEPDGILHCLTRETVQREEAFDVSEDITNLLYDQSTKTFRVPQTFVELPPILLGNLAADVLDNAAGSIIAEGKTNIFMSSPKRYSWDKTRRPINWSMKRNLWCLKPGEPPYSSLHANVLRFLPANGAFWELENPPNENKNISERPLSDPVSPRNPRCDMLTLTALWLIENAYMQLSAYGFNRHLREICVTYPSGWTTAELQSYRECWQKAINIFALNHLAKKGQPPFEPVPKLNFALDEAVATQLPIIYEGVLNEQKNVDNWLDLFGKTDSDGKKSVRIMTLDIGGGTSDSAAVEYTKADESTENTAKVNYKLLFRDSSYNAGDAVVKSILEKVIIPALNPFTGDAKMTGYYKRFWQQQNAKIAYLIRRLLIPIANTILKHVSAQTELSDYANIADGTVLNSANVWFRETQNALAPSERRPLFEDDGASTIHTVVADIIKNKSERINEYFENTLCEDIKTLARHVRDYDIDLLIVSGKPSEMPCVKKLIETYVPLPESRCISVKGLTVGAWYPFRDNNDKIADAKNVNIVGLALSSLVRYHHVTSIDISEKPSESGAANGNKWAHTNNELNRLIKSTSNSNELFPAGSASATVVFNDCDRICRYYTAEQHISTYSPVYQFHGLKDTNGVPLSVSYTAELKLEPNGEISMNRSSLRRKDGKALSAEEKEEIEFRLTMMASDDYWMEKPDLQIAL